MSKTLHKVYVGTMVAIVVLITGYLAYTGYSYYRLPIEERFYHPRYDWFKPSGFFGHGLGIIGTLLILTGVSLYIARKRYNFLGKVIRLKYLLEFHIFLCTLGPILVLFHTSFKFGGIVSVAFWSMVAVVLSGVIGRFIYIQIPRSIEGRALNMNEIQLRRSDLALQLKNDSRVDDSVVQLINKTSDLQGIFLGDIIKRRLAFGRIKKKLRKSGLDRKDSAEIVSLVSDEMALARKITRLEKMQQLFKYWHVAHLPFALVMLIIVLIHVGVTLAFGYKWIF